MAKTPKSYKRTAARIQEGNERLFAAMDALQARIARRMVAGLADLETQSGAVLRTPENLQRMAQVLADAKASFADPQWQAAVEQYLAGFDQLNDDILAYVQSIATTPVDGTALSLLTRNWKQALAEYLTVGSNYQAQLWMPISREIGAYIATGGRYADLIRSVQGIVVGGDGLGRSEGALLGYAKTTVNDGVSAFERTAIKGAADEAGAEFFFYQGSNIDTTRPFCKERAGRYWHRKEVEEWGARAAGGQGWKGMVEGTNSRSIFNYLGGYNCRHLLVPVAKADVPKTELSRMAAAGYLDSL